MLRSVAIPLSALLAVLFGDFGCWAEPPGLGTAAPTAPITAEQRAATGALLIDAMLDPADIPAGLAERSIGREESHPASLQLYLDNGWLMFVSNAWTGETEDLFVSQTVYAFEDEARATSFTPKLLSEFGKIPQATAIPDLPDTAIGSVATYARDGRAYRRVEYVVRVGRLLISIDFGLAAERDDWREVAGALLSAAEQRAQEALNAAGS